MTPAGLQALRRVSRIVAVTGGRWYQDRAKVFAVLDGELATDGIAVLVHGACRTGADHWADEWASERKVNRRWYPADWKTHGDAAGPIRNRHMLHDANPDLLIAFPGGAGTNHCVMVAESSKIKVLRIP